MGHRVASFALSLDLTSLLALSDKKFAEEAIIYGLLLARGAFVSEMLLSNKYKELDVLPLALAPSSIS